MRRISTGKRVELTARDIELFKLLNRYHYLRSTFLYAFLGGGSLTRFKERLGHLYHDGAYINRPVQQWQFANCRYMPVIYELDTKGEQVLRDQGLSDDRGPLLKKGRMGAYRQFSHQLMICDCMASIELGVRERPHLRFISWQEIMAKAPARETDNAFEIPASISYTLPRSQNTQRADIKIVPDGLFELEYTHDGTASYRFFALEADRSTMPVTRGNLHQSSYLRKMLAYQEIAAQHVYRTHLGVPNLLILNVTTNEQHMRALMELVNELTAGKGSKVFLFKTLSTLGDFRVAPAPTSHMLTETWKRAGHDEFAINEK
jgi:Replication-relaxation